MRNTALILDGKKTAEKIQENIRTLIEQRKITNQVIPSLVVILVGDDPASKVYVNKKKINMRGSWHSLSCTSFSEQYL